MLPRRCFLRGARPRGVLPSSSDTWTVGSLSWSCTVNRAMRGARARNSAISDVEPLRVSGAIRERVVGSVLCPQTLAVQAI
jgi:hypothetical protein